LCASQARVQLGPPRGVGDGLDAEADLGEGHDADEQQIKRFDSTKATTFAFGLGQHSSDRNHPVTVSHRAQASVRAAVRYSR
jgi:hypothetical protein